MKCVQQQKYSTCTKGRGIRHKNIILRSYITPNPTHGTPPNPTHPVHSPFFHWKKNNLAVTFINDNSITYYTHTKNTLYMCSTHIKNKHNQWMKKKTNNLKTRHPFKDGLEFWTITSLYSTEGCGTSLVSLLSLSFLLFFFFFGFVNSTST